MDSREPQRSRGPTNKRGVQQSWRNRPEVCQSCARSLIESMEDSVPPSRISQENGDHAISPTDEREVIVPINYRSIRRPRSYLLLDVVKAPNRNPSDIPGVLAADDLAASRLAETQDIILDVIEDSIDQTIYSCAGPYGPDDKGFI